MSSSPKKLTPGEKAQRDAQKAKTQEDLEFAEIVHEADNYCITICDFIRSTLPAERHRLTEELKKLFLSNPEDVYWARGLKNMAKAISRVGDEKAQFTRSLEEANTRARNAQSAADETKRVYEAYRAGVRDGKGEPAPCDMDPNNRCMPRGRPYYPWGW